MGIIDSTCVNPDRSGGSSGQGWSDTLWHTWKHEDKQAKLCVTVEEAYMVKKQLSLNLHFVSCEKMRAKFEPQLMMSARGTVN